MLYHQKKQQKKIKKKSHIQKSIAFNSLFVVNFTIQYTHLNKTFLLKNVYTEFVCSILNKSIVLKTFWQK